MPTSAKRKSHSPRYVSIVSNNPETADGLATYLGQVGVAAHCTRSVRDLTMAAPAFATAAVIFPDDFGANDVLDLLRELRATRPSLLTVLVTREPARFRSALRADGKSPPPVVLPRPSFGWEILDAIRAHVDAAG